MLTKQGLFTGWAVMALLACWLALASEPVTASSFGYHDVRNYGGSRYGGNKYYRPRFAGYNTFYRYRLRNYGKRYNYYPDYGNSYLGDAYNKTIEDSNETTDYDPADLQLDFIDTSNSYNGPGWQLLASGDYPGALHTFSTQSRKEPGNGSLMIGYALAAAMNGDLHKGVSAMRAALRVDPDSLYNLMVQGHFRTIASALIHQYTNDRHRTLATGARDFMIASLHILLGDTDSASLILPAGDTDKSTLNLAHLIVQTRQKQSGKEAGGSAE